MPSSMLSYNMRYNLRARTVSMILLIDVSSINGSIICWVGLKLKLPSSHTHTHVYTWKSYGLDF